VEKVKNGFKKAGLKAELCSVQRKSSISIGDPAEERDLAGRIEVAGNDGGVRFFLASEGDGERELL
jgi:hypothetical protein